MGANLKNEGFAPLYTANQLTLTLVGREERLRIPLSADLRKLPGGNQREQTLAAQADIPLKALLETEPFPSRETLEKLDARFIRENLSPGGTADLLAMVYMLHFLKEEACG